ncbi:MAG: hypothetical protein IT372_32655, partial [Polyangiaceae bacterium]|nr:hypothetical protein [Polyangiaceae bacterium]
CVRRAPEERFASAEEVRATLEEADAFCRAFQLVRASAPAGPPSTAGGVEAVQASFARLTPLAEELVARFYARLFELAPEVRPLFPADLREQRMKLASALQVAVDNLRAPDRLIPMLEDLGRKHAPHGALPEHFDAVGQALLGALAELSGDGWTPRIERAWAEAYRQIAAAMRRGLEEARAAIRPPR